MAFLRLDNFFCLSAIFGRDFQIQTLPDFPDPPAIHNPTILENNHPSIFSTSPQFTFLEITLGMSMEKLEKMIFKKFQ